MKNIVSQSLEWLLPGSVVKNSFRNIIEKIKKLIGIKKTKTLDGFIDALNSTYLLNKIETIEKPKRIAFLTRYPKFKPVILFVRRSINNLALYLNLNYKLKLKKDYYEAVIARHQSLLMRKLGNSDPVLQNNKVKNLRVAIKNLDGLVIKPGKTFSLWRAIGKPTAKKGYVEGMLLKNGQVNKGIGGGLCQLSNLLYWIFLHSSVEIKERYHHSKDAFPDSGRVLPFGSGATILYNMVDLKVKNNSKKPIQIKIWLTEKHIKCQLLSERHFEKKYHVYEKNHYFVKNREKYYRYNELYREVKKEGKTLFKKKITSNFAPVLYSVDKNYIKNNNFKVLEV